MNKEILRYKLVTGKDYPVFAQVGTYRDGSIAVTLACADEEDYGQPFIDVSKHVGFKMPPYYAAIKNYSENEGMVDFLTQNGFGKLTGQKIDSGYVSMPVFQFNKVRLQALDPQGIARYESALRRCK